MTDPDELQPIEAATYEKIVAGLSLDLEGVEVEHQYDFELETGGQKEVDVMIWDRRDGEEVIMVECKYHGSNLNQGYVDEMVGLLFQSSADRGILITKTGFQSGALERARGLREDGEISVDLYELRFYDRENDFEKTINEINTTVKMSSPSVNILQVHDEPVNDSAENQRVEFELSRFESPDVVTRGGDPTGVQFFDVWIEQVEEVYNEYSEVSFEEEETSRFDATAEFEDTYILVEDAIYKIERIDYELVIEWVPVHESSVSLEDTLFEKYDMVLIDALSEERHYINADEALEAFLTNGN